MFCWDRFFYLLKFIFIAMVLSSCGVWLGPGDEDNLATAAQASCGFLQNSYGQRVSWKQSSPVLFYIDPSFSLVEEAAVIRAAQKWEQVVGRPLAVFQKVPRDQFWSPARDRRNTIYYLNEWPLSYSNQQAITHLYWAKNQLLEADIKVNAKYFRYFIEGLDNTSVHFESLMIHELGHALGLTHYYEAPTVMWSILALGVVRNKLSQKDESNLTCEY